MPPTRAPPSAARAGLDEMRLNSNSPRAKSNMKSGPAPPASKPKPAYTASSAFELHAEAPLPVNRPTADREPGERGRDGCRDDRGQHDVERGDPTDDFDYEQHGRDGRVVRGGEPSCGARGDEPADLPLRAGGTSGPERAAEPATKLRSAGPHARLPSRPETIATHEPRAFEQGEAQRDAALAERHGLPSPRRRRACPSAWRRPAPKRPC